MVGALPLRLIGLHRSFEVSASGRELALSQCFVRGVVVQDGEDCPAARSFCARERFGQQQVGGLGFELLGTEEQVSERERQQAVVADAPCPQDSLLPMHQPLLGFAADVGHDAKRLSAYPRR
jgi:hypothetical protein